MRVMVRPRLVGWGWFEGSPALFPLRAAALAVSVITSPFRDPSESLPGRVRPCLNDDNWVPPSGRCFRGAMPVAQGGDLVFEVGERLEAAVDRGEPEVGHLIQVPERAEDGHAHLVRGDLGQAPGPDRFLHLLGQDGQLVLADRPSLAGALHPAALGHHQDDRLLRGEPAPALGAGPAAADRGTVFSGPAVDDPAVRMTAERAVHAITSPGVGSNTNSSR